MKLKRRGALAATAALPATALATPAIAQGKFEWKFPTAFPAQAPGVGFNATNFAEHVDRMSEGRLRLQVFSGGELVPPFAVEDAVQNGTAEIGHGTPYYAAGKNSALHFFTGIPFGMSAVEHVAWLRYGGGQELWDETYAERNLKTFYTGNSNAQAAGWFRKEINSLADLSGLNMRIAGLGGEAMRKVGVNAILMPPQEIFAAFQSGAVDAAEWVGPMLDQAFGMNKVAKLCYAPAFHEPSAALNVAINQDAWNELPEDLQAIVKAAAAADASDTAAQFEYFNVVSMQQLKDDGVEFKTFPDDVLAALREAVAEVMDEQSAENPAFATVRESYDAFLSMAINYAGAINGPSLMQRLG